MRDCTASTGHGVCHGCLKNPNGNSADHNGENCAQYDTAAQMVDSAHIPQWMFEKHAEIYLEQISRMALGHTSGVESSQDIRGALAIADKWLDSVLPRVRE